MKRTAGIGSVAAVAVLITFTQNCNQDDLIRCANNSDCAEGSVCAASNECMTMPTEMDAMSDQTSTVDMDVPMDLHRVFPSGTPVWCMSAGTENYDTTRAVAIDSTGSLIVAGTKGAATAFLHKYTRSTRGVRSAFAFDISPDANDMGTTSIGITSVAVDPKDDSIVLTGVFTGQMRVGKCENQLTSSPAGRKLHQDIFLAKFRASDGECLWATQLESDWGTMTVGTDDEVTGLTIDASQNLALTGILNGAHVLKKIRIGSDYLTCKTPNANSNVFVAKLDRDANPLSFACYHTDGEEDGKAIAVDATGVVHLAGNFGSRGLNIGGVSQNSKGTSDAFVIKYDTTSNPAERQFFQLGAVGRQNLAQSIATVGNEVLLLGQLDGPLPLMKTTLMGQGAFFVWLNNVYDEQGTASVVALRDGEVIPGAVALRPDGSGQSAVALSFRGDIKVGTEMVSGPAATRALVVKYGARGGSLLWLQKLPASTGQAVALDRDGYVLVGGDFKDNVDFGPDAGGVLINKGGQDGFACLLSP